MHSQKVMLRKFFSSSILCLKCRRRHDLRPTPLRVCFWWRKEKMLRFFKVQIEPTDSQKWQAPLWIRETKPRMMITLLNLCKKLFKKFIWAKTGQRIFEAKTTAFTTSSGACAVLRYRSNPLQEKGTASELFLSCQPSSKRSDFKITLFTQFSTDFHAQ